MDVLREFIELVLEMRGGGESVPIRKVVHALTPVVKPYRGDGTDVVLEQSPQGDEVTVHVTGVGLPPGRARQLKSNIQSELERLGWYVGYAELDRGPYGSEVTGTVSVVPRLTKQVTPRGKLYHATSSRNARSILRSGLEPRGPRKIGDYARRKYSPRIYLATDLETALTLRSEFSDMGSQEFVVLEIDPRKVGRKVVFRDDPEMENSVWTEDPIPPDAIRMHDVEDRY